MRVKDRLDMWRSVLASIWGAMGAVCGVIAVAACMASPATAAAAGTPRLVNVPTSVRPLQRVVALAEVPRNRGCRLSLAAKGRVYTRSRATRSVTGELEWTWVVPRGAAAGRNGVAVSCARDTHVARAEITVMRRAGRGSAPLARRIGTVAIKATEPTALHGLGGSSYPQYGAVMVPASAWFGGHGVNVVSNGFADNLSGHWQCVELVNRFVTSEHFGPVIYGNANQLYQDAPATYYDHHPNGSGYIPVPGDIITLGAGTTYGHVVVVDQVVGSTVYVLEQNASASGRNAISLSGSTLGTEYGLRVIGVLHARANRTAAPPPVSTPPTTTPPTTSGQTGPIGDLGFIKLENTGSGAVEVHLDSLQNGGLHRSGDFVSDFSPGDAGNGIWQLFGSVNGAPELGFIKLRNTGGSVEVHWDTLQNGTYKRAGDYTSDFSPGDAGNGSWDLFDASNGVPVLGFVKVSNTGSGTVEAHWDTLQNGTYKRAGDRSSDFSTADGANGVWQMFGSANGAPELGFIKLQNTAGTVEVHWDTIQGASFQRVGDFTSDFSPADSANGSWNLYGSVNGAPELGFTKLRNTGSGTIEGHSDALQGSSYTRTADYASDFGAGDASNGGWQIGDY